MPTDNSTTLVSAFKTGTGWTIDVAACNLSASLAVKDFDPYISGGASLLTNWTKTSQVLVTYTGVALAASTPITIVRSTPITRQQELVYGSRLNTANYEGELNTIHKILYDLSVQPPVLLSPSIIDYLTYDKPSWVANVLQAPTVRAVSLAVDAAILSAASPVNLAVGGTLSVAGNTTMAGTLNVTGAFVVGAGSQYAGTVNITTGNLIVGAGNLTVSGTGAFTGSVGTGNMTVTGTLGASALATLHSATITNTLTQTGAANVAGILTLNNAANTLTTAPNQLTAASTEMVNASWVRKSIRPTVIARAVATAQSIPHGGSGTIVTLNTEDVDTDSTFASNRFTVPTGGAGVYIIDATTTFSASCTLVECHIWVNGAASKFGSSGTFATDIVARSERQAILNLAVGDFVELLVYQLNTGAAARTISGTGFNTSLSICKLGTT